MAYPIRLGEEPTKKRRKKKHENITNTGIKLIDDDLDVPPPIEPERIQRGQKDEYSPSRIKRKRKRIDNSPKRNDDNDFDDLPRNNHINEGNDDNDLSPPRKRVVTEEPDDMDDIPRKRVKREDSSEDENSRVDKSMQIKISGKVPVRTERKTTVVDPKVLEKEKRDWALGTAQKRELEQKKLEYLSELEKPFSRTADDKELEDSRKSLVRFGDPMANYGKKNKKKKSKQEKPKYNGPPAPPNRFNIQPGFRWDGIDRTNGFEKRFFKRAAERKALTEVAYKWSVEDM